MNSRQEKVFKCVVEYFVRFAQPVGSRTLVEDYRVNASAATIRNDMAILEDLGLIYQPHTSAGRIPTEKGYYFYLKRFVHPRPQSKNVNQMQSLMTARSPKNSIKVLAKAIAELTGETVVIAERDNQSYYTGVSNLLNKPDFSDVQMLRSASELFDQFDEIVEQMFELATDELQVMIGTGNPFGEQMSSIVVRYALPNNKIGLIGLIGPMRMNYTKNLCVLKSALEVLAKQRI